MAWQKEVPSRDGLYWTATQDGHLSDPQRVIYGLGRLIYAGGFVADGRVVQAGPWKGWWWSEPIAELEPPASDAWEKT